MAACRGSSSKWYFTREQLENTPSRRCGVESDRELSYRQQAANLIQDMGQRLNVSQLTINTAIVYMHRFYMQHSFTKFHRNIISPTTLFLAAKVEEQPRKLEHVIKVAHACLNPQESPLDTKSNAYLQQAQELVILESIVLQTLGFEITIDHPHTDVVKCTQLVRASKDLAQTSYFMATNSLHLTTFCLQYKPTVIACVCIHLACKWSNWEIPVSTDGKHWWKYVDSTVTLELLDELTHEFLQILEKTPSRLKRIRNWRATQAAKKPKSENMQSMDNTFTGPSLLQDHGDTALPGVSSSNPSFSKAGAAFSVPMPGHSRGVPLSLDAMAATYSPASHSEWPQTSTSSLLQHPLPYKTEKTVDLNLVKQEKGTAGKHHSTPQPAYPPSGQPLVQKLSLDKYREKHSAEYTVQKRRQEPHGEHRKHAQPHQASHSGSTTPSPLKMKIPSSSTSSGQDRRHHGDKSLLKLRLPVPGSSSNAPPEKSGQPIKDEFKMKIKVSSSERHSSSDEGISANNSKSKHSSPLVSKEKHRSTEHNLHRPHKHSGNGRGAAEAAGTALGHPSSATLTSSSRKRAYAEGGHNHHPSSSTSCSKVSKISKSGTSAAGGLRTSQQFLPPGESPHEVGEQRH
uniref:Cyclin T2a n=1 Tax=Xiphophorus couchianus TaxID=32473 RepID=A0A3B5M565_9TELE